MGWERKGGGEEHHVPARARRLIKTLSFFFNSFTFTSEASERVGFFEKSKALFQRRVFSACSFFPVPEGRCFNGLDVICMGWM
jgi:hypothetical protein